MLERQISNVPTDMGLRAQQPHSRRNGRSSQRHVLRTKKAKPTSTTTTGLLFCKENNPELRRGQGNPVKLQVRALDVLVAPRFKRKVKSTAQTSLLDLGVEIGDGRVLWEFQAGFWALVGGYGELGHG